MTLLPSQNHSINDLNAAVLGDVTFFNPLPIHFATGGGGVRTSPPVLLRIGDSCPRPLQQQSNAH